MRTGELPGPATTPAKIGVAQAARNKEFEAQLTGIPVAVKKKKSNNVSAEAAATATPASVTPCTGNDEAWNILLQPTSFVSVEARTEVKNQLDLIGISDSMGLSYVTPDDAVKIFAPHLLKKVPLARLNDLLNLASASAPASATGGSVPAVTPAVTVSVPEQPVPLPAPSTASEEVDSAAVAAATSTVRRKRQLTANPQARSTKRASGPPSPEPVLSCTKPAIHFDEKLFKKCNIVGALDVGDIVVLKIGNQVMGEVLSVPEKVGRSRGGSISVLWRLGSASATCSVAQLYKVIAIV